MKRTRSDSNHANVSIPVELVEFVNRWLQGSDARDIGIQSRRDLTITLYQIMLQKIASLGPKLQARGQWKHRNDTLPRELFDMVAEAADERYITKALWLPQPTSMLAFALSRFLTVEDRAYAELVKALTITSDDIRRHKAGKESANAKRVPSLRGLTRT